MPRLQDVIEQGNGHIAELFKLLTENNDLLGELLSNASEEEMEREYITRNAQVNSGATNTVDIEIGPVPPGCYWIVKLLTTTGGVGGPCAVYFDNIAPGNLAFFISNAQIFAPAGALEIYVRERRKMIFHFYSQPNNQDCTVLVQARQYRQAATEKAVEGGGPV